MKFNKDSRVKIPAILHLIRLGYEYFSLKKTQPDLLYIIMLTDVVKKVLC
jgi:hypothetical protein